jgi:hypothetical protein
VTLVFLKFTSQCYQQKMTGKYLEVTVYSDVTLIPNLKKIVHTRVVMFKFVSETGDGQTEFVGRVGKRDHRLLATRNQSQHQLRTAGSKPRPPALNGTRSTNSLGQSRSISRRAFTRRNSAAYAKYLTKVTVRLVIPSF